MKKNAYFLIFIIICGLIPISNTGFWADEAWTIIDFALLPLNKLLQALIDGHGGDAQFPGYNFYICLWVKIFGASEISARMANLPLFYTAVFYCYFYLPRNTKFKMGFLSLICLSPLIWFYLNESRYIISVFSFSLISFSSLLSYFEGDEKNRRSSVYVFLISIILGTAFMMLYLFFVLFLVILGFYYLRKNEETLKSLFIKWKIPIIVSLLLLSTVVSYYLYTILTGMGGTRQNPSFKNVGFVLYEFLGFAGIGPPREELRRNSSIDINSSYIIGLVAFALIYFAFIILFFLKYRSNKDKLALYGLSGLVLTFLLFFFFAKFFHFKFLGRHLVFFYVPFLFFTYTLIYKTIQVFPKTGYSLIVLYFACILYSNFNIRFNPAYEKTNIAKAYNVVTRESKGLKVIWLEERRGFLYYAVYKNNVKDYNDKYIFVNSENSIERINKYISKERYLILVNKRKDYGSEIKNYLINRSYKVVYNDKDYTVYR